MRYNERIQRLMRRQARYMPLPADEKQAPLGEISPRLRGEISPRLRGELSPRLRGELSPRLRGELSPRLRGELSPRSSGAHTWIDHGSASCPACGLQHPGSDSERMFAVEQCVIKHFQDCADACMAERLGVLGRLSSIRSTLVHANHSSPTLADFERRSRLIMGAVSGGTRPAQYART